MSNLKLKFCGGVGSVTGANFLLTDGKIKILVDCGLEQGSAEKGKDDPNRAPFPYNPAEIDYLFVTHAHADHIGRIPKLVKDGFRGQIFSTPNTLEISKVMFEDSVKINEREAKEHDMEPNYIQADADKAISMWKTIEYHTEFDLNADFKIYLKDAGHILGSAIIQITYVPENKKIAFTGDLGNSPTPLIRDAEFPEGVDYLVMESVYGNRNHEDKENRKVKLKNFIQRIIERKGTLLIPVFSLEKTQVILHEMNEMIEEEQIKSVPVFLDSPLGIKLTEIYAQQFSAFNEKVQARILSGDQIFDFPKLYMTSDAKDSERIHNIEGPKIILAGAGMSTGGRIMEHERRYLADPKNGILFIGFQVAGSLGRQILEKSRSVRINGETVYVKAEVEVINGYSSHMDSDHLVEFVGHTADTVKKVFCVMGEPQTAMFLAQRLRDEWGVDAVHPTEGETVELK